MTSSRAVVVTHTAQLGGAELALERLLAAIDREQWDVRVITLGPGPLVDRLRATGIPVEVVDERDLAQAGRETAGRVLSVVGQVPGAVRTMRRLRSALRRDSPDLVVANSLKAAVLVPGALTFSRVPWVWHLHDRLARDYLPSAAVRGLRLLASRGPHTVVANSRATQAELPRRARDHTVVAYPGVDPSLGAVARERPQPPVVGLVGRIGPTKGQREFVQAARLVARSRPDVRFVIIGAALFGDQDYESAVRAEAGDAVAWLGWTDDPVGAIAGLTVLAHASPVPEPFGQVVAEAVCLGVGVVATEAGGVPEILAPRGVVTDASSGLRHGDHGLLVKPGDVEGLARALEAAIACQDGADGDGSRRASAVEALSIDRTAATVNEAWSAALASRRGG